MKPASSSTRPVVRLVGIDGVLVFQTKAEAETKHAIANRDPGMRRGSVLKQQDARRRIALRLKPQGGAAGFFSDCIHHHGGSKPWHSV